MPELDQGEKKKGERKKVLYNWIVIIIMVGSILGFAIVASQGTQQPSEQPPPIGPPTTITYNADWIDTNVVQILNTMIITAGTDNPEINEINTAVYSIEGIKRVSSYYMRSTDTSIEGTLIYVAEIAFEAGYSAKELLDKIKDIEFLNGVEAMSYALISLPATVTLRNNDLNITKEYTFPNQLAQAFVFLDTITNDNLIVAIEITLAGESPTKTLIAEQYNITAEPQEISLVEEYEIESMEQELQLQGLVDYSNSLSLDYNSLKEQIEALKNVDYVSIDVGNFYPSITIVLDGDYSEEEQDINVILASKSDITWYDFYLDQNMLIFDFNSDSDFIALKNSLLKDLEEAEIGIEEFIEPTIAIDGDVSLTTREARQTADTIINMFLEKNIFPGVTQYAIIRADSFQDKDTNSTYAIDAGTFRANVSPQHSSGESIMLEVSFTGIRDKATEIRAIEEKLQ